MKTGEEIQIAFVSKAKIALPAALFVVSVPALFGPVQIYLNNTMEFSFSFLQTVGVLLVGFVVAVSVLAFLLALLPARGNLFGRGIAFACVLGLAFWIQGNLLVWQYGLMDGKDIDWGAKALYGWIDMPVWLILLGAALLRPGFWMRHAVRLSVMFLIVQIIATTPLLGKAREAASFKTYSASEDNLFSFSKHTNVIILILDTFQSDVFQQILEEDLGNSELFEGFTYFRNTMGGYPTTYGSISYILTGLFYENREPVQTFLKRAFLSDSSIPKTLMEEGFRVDLHPGTEKTVYFGPETLSNLARPAGVTIRDVAYLYGLTLFRYLPHFTKRFVLEFRDWAYRDARPSPPRQQASVASAPAQTGIFSESALQVADVRFVSDMSKKTVANTDAKVFKFYHRSGLHPPVVLTEQMEYGRLPFNRSNYVGFAKATLQMTRVFLDALRQIEAYDDSMIFILGDHGYSDPGLGVRLPEGRVSDGIGDGRVPEHVRGSAIPLLLVKPIGGDGPLRTSDAPASLGDIPATIFAGLGMSRECDGISVFDLQDDARRPRRFLHYNWTHATWKREYLPTMTEYEVNGFAWDSAAWRPTGRTFVAPVR